MKICRVMRTYPRAGRGGAGLPGWELTRHISEPTLYITRAESGAPFPVPAHAHLCEVQAWDPIALSPSDSLTGARAGLKVASYGMFFAAGARRMMTWGPDIIHAHSLPALLYGAVGSRLLGVPWTFTFHGTELERAIRGPMRRLVERANAIFYVSEHMKPRLRAAFPSSRLEYTPSGVDLDAFRPDWTTARENVLVCIARFQWQKGHQFLADALPSILGAHPGYSMVVVGSGPGEAEFRSALLRHGIADSVRIVPSLERDQVATLLRRSTLLVLPSVTEGFPKVILEAMASGTPVVTTDVGCCANVVADAGVVVRPADSAALSEGVDRLLRDRAALHHASRRAREQAQNFAWEATAQRVSRVFRDLISRAAA